MTSPNTLSRPRMNFIAAMGAPRKDPLARKDTRLAALEAQVQSLLKENAKLKERLRKVEEAQAIGDQSLRIEF